ncbi:peptidase family M3 [Thozetella sp. PMI_491]|nr:peptidase family M3 [Thozetella sp. PMI_491]
MIPEQYRNPPQLAPLFNATKNSIINETQARCKATRALLDKIVAEVSVETATFRNVLLPIEQDRNVAVSTVPADIYRKVASEPGLRDAAVQAMKISQAFEIECLTREDIFRLVDAVFQKNESLDPESRRALEQARQKYIQNGLALPSGLARDRYKAIAERLSEVSTDFIKNIDENTGGIWLSPEEIVGLPQDAIEGLEKGTDLETGKLKVTFKLPDCQSLMRFALSPETRKAMYIARENRCSENIPLIEEGIRLRNEAALLLGYLNHAERKLELQMAKTPDKVMDFLDGLCGIAGLGVKKEVEKLQAAKRVDLSARGMPPDDNIYVWDIAFYEHILRKQEHNLDQLKISEYFPFHPTLSGMLRLFGHLFGLVFIEIRDEDRQSVSPTGKTEDIIWNEDVVLYSVWNAPQCGNTTFVGYLYLDMYPRPGKYSHACCDLVRGGFLNDDGTRCYPATCIMTNFTKPTSSKPSLLNHDEVVVLFHELGHGIHHLSIRTTYSRFNADSVAGDFLELPSEMLENWCWIPSCLKSFSSHYVTGATIPDEMVQSLVDAKHFNEAIYLIRQLNFALFDMNIHTYPVHEKAIKYPELFNSLYFDLTGIKGPEDIGMPLDWGHYYASFRHLFCGYDAAYYGYQWSKVYSMDIFASVFEKDPMNQEEGRRYRQIILEKGGSKDEALMLEQFLGRKPSAEAFYQELGWTELKDNQGQS